MEEGDSTKRWISDSTASESKESADSTKPSRNVTRSKIAQSAFWKFPSSNAWDGAMEADDERWWEFVKESDGSYLRLR